MSWIEIIPALIVALSLLLLPGLLFGWLAGLRGITLAGVAGPVSVGFLAIASVILPLIRLAWIGPVIVGAVAVLAVGLGLLFRRFWRASEHGPSEPGERSAALRSIAVVLVGGAALSFGLMLAVGNPNHFDQAFDNVFHLNAIRYALDSGSASPLTLGHLTNPGDAIAFYPSAWHGLNAAVMSMAGASIPLANNAVLIALCLTVWPLGLLLLANRIFGRGIEVAIAVALFVPAFILFPLHLLFFGPLPPMILGIALLPTALALTLDLCVPDQGGRLKKFGAVVLLVGVLGGIGISHPGVLLAWLVMADLAAFVWILQRWSTLTWKHRLVSATSIAAFWVVSVVLLLKLQPSDQASRWGPNLSPLRVFGELVTGALMDSTIPFITALFVMSGLVILWVRRSICPATVYLLVWFAGIGFLYFVTAAQNHGWPRQLLTGSWYQDPNRLGTMLIVLMIPVACASFVFVWRALTSRFSGPALIALLVVLTLLGAATWAGSQVRAVISGTKPLFALTEQSGLLSIDELVLLERLPAVVPEDAVVAGNPWQGAGMAYAFSDRHVLMPHMFVSESKDRDLILDQLNAATPGSNVCGAINREDVEYVLDFPGPSVLGSGRTFSGLQELETSSAVKLIDREGAAKLYEVVGCD